MVLDLMLPGIDGLEVMRRMREHQRRRSAIILLTAKGEPTDRVTGLRLGAPTTAWRNRSARCSVPATRTIPSKATFASRRPRSRLCSESLGQKIAGSSRYSPRRVSRRLAKLARIGESIGVVSFLTGPAANNLGQGAVVRRHAVNATRQRTPRLTGSTAGPVACERARGAARRLGAPEAPELALQQSAAQLRGVQP